MQTTLFEFYELNFPSAKDSVNFEINSTKKGNLGHNEALENESAYIFNKIKLLLEVFYSAIF